VDLQFTIGRQDERCTVRFQHDKFWGRTSITVNGHPVLERNKPFEVSLNLVKRHSFRVGPAGRHHVVVEVERKLVLAGLRPMRYRAFVDGTLVTSRIG
jgi:hypothetical protein